MSAKQFEATITFKAKLFTIGAWTILRMPDDASAKLPSRGQVMVEGTFAGIPLRTPLEPDGNWSHWFKVSKKLQDAAHVSAGDVVELTVTPTKEWPEPDVPAELQQALEQHPKAYDLWQEVTPLAHWEWIRWIRSTGKDETRKKRIEVACSKLEAGKRRPCCWNRNLSTEPSVSKNGVLLVPASQS